MEAGVDDHPLEAGRGDHLRAHHRLSHRSRAHPQQAPQIDAVRRGELGIEVIAEIDEGHCFAHGRGRSERGKNDRVAASRPSRYQLDELSTLQAAAEEGIEGLESRGDDRRAVAVENVAEQLRSAADFCGNGRVERGAQLPESRTLPRFYSGWRWDQGGGGAARLEIEELELPIERASGRNHQLQDMAVTRRKQVRKGWHRVPWSGTRFGS